MFAISKARNSGRRSNAMTEYVTIPGDQEYLTVEEAKAIADLNED